MANQTGLLLSVIGMSGCKAYGTYNCICFQLLVFMSGCLFVGQAKQGRPSAGQGAWPVFRFGIAHVRSVWCDVVFRPSLDSILCGKSEIMWYLWVVGEISFEGFACDKCCRILVFGWWV